MSRASVDLACHRIERARSCLDDARLLFSHQKFNSTANRCYYAAFYAARALLALRGLDSSKHAGVITFFQREFVKTRTIPKDIGKALQTLFDTRIDGDYRDLVVIDEGRARNALELAEAFIAAVSSCLDRLASQRGTAATK